jgi:hypothetical protein
MTEGDDQGHDEHEDGEHETPQSDSSGTTEKSRANGKKTLGRRKLTRGTYDALVEGFRVAPGNASNAARTAACDRRMAARAWASGWRDYPWARPIRDVLADEARDARALAARLAREEATRAEADREKARRESVEALAQEQQILKAARNDVLAVLVLGAELVPAMRSLAKVVAQACLPGPGGEPPDVSPSAAMGLLTRHASLVSKGVGAAETILQLSRLDRGASTANVAVAVTGVPEDMTTEAALAELEQVEAVLLEARARAALAR